MIIEEVPKIWSGEVPHPPYDISSWDALVPEMTKSAEYMTADPVSIVRVGRGLPPCK